MGHPVVYIYLVSVIYRGRAGPPGEIPTYIVLSKVLMQGKLVAFAYTLRIY